MSLASNLYLLYIRCKPPVAQQPNLRTSIPTHSTTPTSRLPHASLHTSHILLDKKSAYVGRTSRPANEAIIRTIQSGRTCSKKRATAVGHQKINYGWHMETELQPARHASGCGSQDHWRVVRTTHKQYNPILPTPHPCLYPSQQRPRHNNHLPIKRKPDPQPLSVVPPTSDHSTMSSRWALTTYCGEARGWKYQRYTS